MKPEIKNCPPPPHFGLAAAERLWKNKKPRFFPSPEPYVPEHGPSRMLPSSTLGTCDGFGAPPGHCNARDVTPSNVLPAGEYETMQPFGVPMPGLADVHAGALPVLLPTERVPALPPVLK